MVNGPTNKRASRRGIVKKKVAVIGTGWYGIEIAKAITNHSRGKIKVVLFEKGNQLASGTSGSYSSRLHPSGLHYLRVRNKVVDYLKQHAREMRETRGNYLRPNYEAVHAIVNLDANGKPSRTNVEQFRERYALDSTAKVINPNDFGLRDVQEAVTITEERIINGPELREQFRLDLREQGIEFLCDTPVKDITKQAEGNFVVQTDRLESTFDNVINATGFQNFIPESFKDNPFNIEIVYQAACGLLYEDMQTGVQENFSLLFLDGANPCLMQSSDTQYILTHGKYTLLASRRTPEEAHQALQKANELNLVESKVRPAVEEDLLRYYPRFFERFRYVGHNSGVIAKILSETEFRLGFALQTPDKVIHAMLGKISNAPAVARECVDLVEGRELIHNQGYAYPNDGIFINSIDEIGDKPKHTGVHYAALVNPYPELDTFAQESTYANSSSNHSSMWKRARTDGRLQRSNGFDEMKESSPEPRAGRRLRSDSLTSEIREGLNGFGFN